jgi:hypothetical protein
MFDAFQHSNGTIPAVLVETQSHASQVVFKTAVAAIMLLTQDLTEESG